MAGASSGALATFLFVSAPTDALAGGSALPVHGAVSATFSGATRYDFLGNTADTAGLNHVEALLNTAHRFQGGLSASAQLYAYRLSDFTEISIDYAQLDYSFSPWFGVRIGRVKNAFGLYGEYQDIDVVRPFAYIPMQTYNPNQRTFNSAFDGVKFYGSFETENAGWFDYQIFGGQMVPSPPENPFWRSFDPQFPMQTTATYVHEMYGAWLDWNTPIDGLRVGISSFEMPAIDGAGPMKSAADASNANTDFRVFPSLLPDGVWDAAVAGNEGTFTFDVRRSEAFVEYTVGDWQYAAQFMRFNFDTAFTFPVFGELPSKWDADSYFLLTTWQATSRLQLGACYSASFNLADDHDGSSLQMVPHHRGYQKDWCLSAACRLSDQFLVKAEVHSMDGTQNVGDGDNGDVLGWKPRWGYYILKSTFTF